jgi:DNA-binding transcriptional ArsR family regulator
MLGGVSDSGHTRLHDPRVLRAIAHPVRNRILGEMSARGHLRAADVAEELGIPANQASFHLRQLAKYGLVEEAPEQARDGRDRVWRLTHEAGFDVRLAELRTEPGGEAAVGVYRRSALAQHAAALERAFAPEHPPDVRVMVSDEWLRLSKQEADEFCAELLALHDRWRQRTRERAEEAPDTRTYHVLQVVQPETGTPGSGD